MERHSVMPTIHRHQITTKAESLPPHCVSLLTDGTADRVGPIALAGHRVEVERLRAREPGGPLGRAAVVGAAAGRVRREAQRVELQVVGRRRGGVRVGGDRSRRGGRRGRGRGSGRGGGGSGGGGGGGGGRGGSRCP